VPATLIAIRRRAVSLQLGHRCSDFIRNLAYEELGKLSATEPRMTSEPLTELGPDSIVG
jgi:hypothetical protein